MTLGEFRSLTVELDDSIELRIMTQQNYPHENTICSIVDDQTLAVEADDESEDGEDEGGATEKGGDTPKFLYIVEGSWVGYGNKNAWGR